MNRFRKILADTFPTHPSTDDDVFSQLETDDDFTPNCSKCQKPVEGTKYALQDGNTGCALCKSVEESEKVLAHLKAAQEKHREGYLSSAQLQAMTTRAHSIIVDALNMSKQYTESGRPDPRIQETLYQMESFLTPKQGGMLLEGPTDSFQKLTATFQKGGNSPKELVGKLGRLMWGVRVVLPEVQEESTVQGLTQILRLTATILRDSRSIEATRRHSAGLETFQNYGSSLKALLVEVSKAGKEALQTSHDSPGVETFLQGVQRLVQEATRLASELG